MIITNDLMKIYQLEGVVVNALVGVSLEIANGDFVAIMGASGSGKSTLMNLLGCLDTPTSGTYELDGILINSLTDDELAGIRTHKIGFVFQSYNLLSKLNAIDQVSLPLIYSGTPNRKELAAEALITVGLGDRMHHRPTELSGGQQQRVGIARALVKNPSLILADEPTGNLDSHSTGEILDLFQQLNEERDITVVLVTHEPEVAGRAGRIVTMRDGEVISDELRRVELQRKVSHS